MIKKIWIASKWIKTKFWHQETMKLTDQHVVLRLEYVEIYLCFTHTFMVCWLIGYIYFLLSHHSHPCSIRKYCNHMKKKKIPKFWWIYTFSLPFNTEKQFWNTICLYVCAPHMHCKGWKDYIHQNLSTIGQCLVNMKI